MAEKRNGVDWKEVRRPNPHFFKLLVGDFAKSMKIPSNFHKHLEVEMGTNPSSSTRTQIQTAILEGPTGRTWHVKMERTKDDIFFTSGWTNFIKDHSLQKRELLIFRYNGCMQFTVLIFDKTCCEKKGDFGENYETTKSWSKRTCFDEGYVDINSCEDLSDQEHQEDSVIDETTISQDGEGVKLGKRTKGDSRTKRLSRRRSVTEKEKISSNKAAYSFASENPFFVIRMSHTHVYPGDTMRFPIEFSKKYLPRTKCEFVLRVATDRTWSVNYNPSVKERDRLCGGWSTFVRDNDLEEDDYCVFELVKSTECLVHIFRAVGLQII